MVAQKSTRIAIYGLIDPRTHRIRYVGKTVHLEQRWRDHVREARYEISHRTLKGRWMRELSMAGLHPDLIVIEECGDDWPLRERHWIKRISGLLNETCGGETGCKPEAAEKISAALKANKARHGPAWRKKHADAMRGKRHSAETKKKMGASRRGNQNALRYRFIVTDPRGTECVVDNLFKFCNANSLHFSAMYRVAKGDQNRTQHKGWRCRFA
jgi:hypothetical protein